MIIPLLFLPLGCKGPSATGSPATSTASTADTTAETERKGGGVGWPESFTPTNEWDRRLVSSSLIVVAVVEDREIQPQSSSSPSHEELLVRQVLFDDPADGYDVFEGDVVESIVLHRSSAKKGAKETPRVRQPESLAPIGGEAIFHLFLSESGGDGYWIRTVPPGPGAIYNVLRRTSYTSDDFVSDIGGLRLLASKDLPSHRWLVSPDLAEYDVDNVGALRPPKYLTASATTWDGYLLAIEGHIAELVK